jgi:hypothetical protein
MPGNFKQKEAKDEAPIAKFSANEYVQRMYRYVDGMLRPNIFQFDL